MNGSTTLADRSLFLAVANGNLSKARVSLHDGANPNATNDMGQLPVLIAVRRKDHSMLKLLMEHGADLRATTQDNLYPMALAAIMGDIEAVRFMGAYCADFESPVETEPSALEHALISGQLITAQELIRHGADIESIGAQGDTLLARMAAMGNDTAVCMLLDEGAWPTNLDFNGISPVGYAKKNGKKSTAKLIDARCRAQIERQQTGEKSSRPAKRSNINSLGMLEQLTAIGQKAWRQLDWRQHERNRTTRQLIAELKANDTEAALKTLDKTGFTINAHIAIRPPLTFLALHAFCLADLRSEDRDAHKLSAVQKIIERLMTKGVDPLAIDANSGRNLFHEMIDVKQEALAHHFLMKGLFNNCINRSDHNLDRPLHFAARHGMRRLVLSLIQKGADINTVNRLGETPLHICAMHLDVQTAEILVGKGANRNLRAKNGHTVKSLLKNFDKKSHSFSIMLEARHSIENAMSIFSADNPMTALARRSDGKPQKQ